MARGESTRPSRGTVIAYWVFTGLFALQMGFTAYAQLSLPQAMQVFAHLGFPDYFRIELCTAKFVGLVVLLVPMVPAVFKEWAYAGFAIVLVSAVIAHLAVGEGVAAWIWAVGTFVLEALSYAFYRRHALAGRAVVPMRMEARAAE
jgi:DoxX-like family